MLSLAASKTNDKSKSFFVKQNKNKEHKLSSNYMKVFRFLYWICKKEATSKNILITEFDWGPSIKYTYTLMGRKRVKARAYIERFYDIILLSKSVKEGEGVS